MNKIFEKIQTMVEAQTDWFGYLYDRWQEEKKYEPWADYQKAMKTRFEKDTKGLGFTFIRSKKRPFGYEFSLPSGLILLVYVNSRRIGWKVVK